jgi:hypothetical protein
VKIDAVCEPRVAKLNDLRLTGERLLLQQEHVQHVPGGIDAQRLREIAFDRSILFLHLVERRVEVLGLDPEYGHRNGAVAAGGDEVVDRVFELRQCVIVGAHVVGHDRLLGHTEQRQQRGSGPAGAVLAGGAMKHAGGFAPIRQRQKKGAIGLLRSETNSS